MNVVSIWVTVISMFFHKVKKVLNHGAGDYLEITFNNKEILVPFNFDHILKIDVLKNELHLNTDYYEI